jgi:hypothetical protein
METAVWRGVVVVQHLSVCSAWSHMCHPFPESSKDFPIKSLIDGLSWWHKFLVDDPLTVKKNWALIWFWVCSFRFLGTGRVCSVPLPTLVFCLGVILHNPSFITCDNATEEFLLPRKAVQKIKTYPSDWPCAQSWGFLEPSWHTLFSCPNPMLKFDGL